MSLAGDPFVSLIAGIEDAAPAADFHGQLCEAMCRAVELDRGVLFQYDPDLRRVRPLGVHAVDIGVFGEVYVSPDTASFVRDALERDEIIEISGDDLGAYAGAMPASFLALAEGRRVICSPLIASGRWVGLLIADRAATAPPLSADERAVLHTLGKGVALATLARRATRKDERTRALRQRIDLARDVHDGVVQRLFGVSLALGGDGDLPAAERIRCADEVQAAMVELRTMVRGLGAEEIRAPDGTFEEELARWQAAHEDLSLTLDQRAPDDIPEALQGLAQAMLSESLRNARKHGSPRTIQVRTRRIDGTLSIEVENDGAPAGGRVGQPGMGLRLLGVQALHAGGFLDFGARGGDAWQVRLVVPVAGA